MFQSLMFHYGIPFLNYITDTCNYIYDLCVFTYDSMIRGIYSDTLYFFEKNPNLYVGSFVDVDNRNNGVVVWKYSRFRRTFFQYNCMYKDVKHFPIISAYISFNNESVYTLDEFFNNLIIERTNNTYPTLQQVLEVWVFTEGVVLNRNKSYKFIYMDTHLNEFTLDLFTGEFVFTT